MKKTLTNLSQLSKAMFKDAPKVGEVKPAPPKAKDDGGEVLKYFSKTLPGEMASVGAPVETRSSDELRELKCEVERLREKVGAIELIKADLERELDKARREITRLQGECGRLQGEVRKGVQAPEIPKGPVVEPVADVQVKEDGLLKAPSAFDEAFEGEAREMLLAALMDARDAARQGTKDRRATVLDAILAVNKSNGEIGRRRAELKQIMKDSGYYTDPSAFEALGFRLISGRTHWKLQYGNVRLTIAKTPSDYRSALNAAADMANRCF